MADTHGTTGRPSKNRPSEEPLPFIRRLAAALDRRTFMVDIVILCATPLMALMLWGFALSAPLLKFYFSAEVGDSIDLDAISAPFKHGYYVAPMVEYTIYALVTRLALLAFFGLYARRWRYATLEDMLLLVIATAFSVALTVPPYMLVIDNELFDLPRPVPVIDSVLAFMLLAGVRSTIRLIYQTPVRSEQSGRTRALIVGAGVAGQLIVRDLRANAHLGCVPVAFLDDDPQKQHLHIVNTPVLGGLDTLPQVLASHRVGQVIIAMPHAAGSVIRSVLRQCEEAGVDARIIPGMSSILDGRVQMSTLRKVEIEDLLRRPPVATDTAGVREMLHGKRVMVTGGGGSIGGELCRQVLTCGPAQLAVLGHGENSVFEIVNELRDYLRKHGLDKQIQIRPFIADIRFPRRMRSVMQEFRPDVVFHAAAHKHVPLMEENPTEAITNNVFGTRNVLEAAMEAGCPRFVMVSTDKAVNPSSVMGATKRCAELLVMRAARATGRRYVAVRFGNVLGSRGSVVPTFRKQIAAGGPITVSHPDMTRYFMTIPEAVQLLLQAATLGHGGEVFMLDMGDPVKIVDLARDIIQLSGLEVGHDIDIVFTGTRPGEKLFEELLIHGESYEPTAHDKIRVARDASGAPPADLDANLEGFRMEVERDDAAAVVQRLGQVVPEFRADGPGCAAAAPPLPAEDAQVPTEAPAAPSAPTGQAA